MNRKEFVAMVAEQFEDNIGVDIDRAKFITCLEGEVDGTGKSEDYGRRLIVNDFLDRYKVHQRLQKVECWGEVDIFDAPVDTHYFSDLEWCPDHGIVSGERYKRYVDWDNGTEYVLDVECPECTRLLKPSMPVDGMSTEAYGVSGEALEKKL